MTLTATVLHLAALCWLSSQARADTFLHTRTEGEYPTAWRRAAIPRDGIYFVSATVDGKDNASIQSLITVKANGRILFKAFAEGMLTGTAMAFSLKAGDNITAVKSGVSAYSPRCSLTVAYVDSVNDTYFFAWVALNNLKRFLESQLINFEMAWSYDGWLLETPGQYYFSISRPNTYWVMARTMGSMFPYGYQRMEVRCKSTDPGGRLFRIVVRSQKPSSCAGAFRLQVGYRVYMTPHIYDVRLFSNTMLSMVELKPPKGSSLKHTHAVAFIPDVKSERDCQALGYPLTWDTINSLDFRDKTSQDVGYTDPHFDSSDVGVILTSNISSADKIPEGFALHFRYVHQLGYMSLRYHKVAIELQITGVYLLCMRPFAWTRSDPSGIAMTRNGGRPVWVVMSRGREGTGDIVAYRLTHGTRLRYYLFSSSTCKIDMLNSIVSVALAQAD